MKLFIFSTALFAMVLTSCEKNDAINKDDGVATPNPALYTNDSITVKDFTVYKPKSVVRDQFHLLGYGYDVTGEYADSASARKQVVDVAKLDASYPHRVENWRSTSSSGQNSADQDAGGLVYAISGQTEDYRFSGLDVKGQESKKYYKKEISSYFPNSEAYSTKYIYGRQSLELITRILFFN